MDLLAAEADIVSHLQSDISATKIQSFPRDPSQAYRLLHHSNAILVRYNRSLYADPMPNRKKGISQIRTLEWIVTMVHKNLVEHDGVYAKLEAVRDSLTGYTVNSIAYSTVLRPLSDGFVSEDGGVWVYEMTFQHDIETWEAFQ